MGEEHERANAHRRGITGALLLGAVGGATACVLAVALLAGDPIVSLVAAATLVVAGLAVARLVRAENRFVASLRRATVTDPLTHLLNRRGFQERIEIELARAKRDGTPMVLMVGDVDEFKQINDQLGHLGGDMALERLSGVIARTTRDADAIARLGGDEFAFILPNTTGAQALALAERIRTTAEESFTGTAAVVTLSLGAAEYPADARTSEELLDAADEAMYEAKALGRNRAVLHTRENRETASSGDQMLALGH